jgi:transposase-like protein
LLQPRRARCRGCAGTHVLLPEVALLRRQDEVAVIGAAIEANVAGSGFRSIASRLGVHAGTVRGWLRRFAERAGLIRAHFTRWAVVLDPELGPVMPAGSTVADALEAIAVAARAWVLRFGPGDPWRIASVLSGGVLLATRTAPLPPVS